MLWPQVRRHLSPPPSSQTASTAFLLRTGSKRRRETRQNDLVRARSLIADAGRCNAGNKLG